ncbi:hypothetical protein [Glycomyces albidus]|uniref:Uncharacterized protein n=1 Tax=Glycomyces albidus TaxID=2656774 RepID=A0A6L5GBW4_9ACTN|nr:hypothetical protein [Glycomyces albidus]MQM27154.1 hypothetical protein [Glycomyces albidus]
MIGQTPGETGAETEVARVLRQASDGYGDLPDEVAHRLDRVLEALPAADTLHTAAAQRAPEREGFLASIAERLRPKRVRYAIASGAAAVLVTVGAVAVGLQALTTPSEEDAGSAQVHAEDAPGSVEDEDYAAEEASPQPGDDPVDAQSEDGELGLPGVESFASGTDYSESTDLLAALRGLGRFTAADAVAAEVPAELEPLAAGGEFWRACEEAIAEEYQSLLVAVDFATYESSPAIIALLASDQGEIAVALSPACADGIIEALAVQR